MIDRTTDLDRHGVAQVLRLRLRDWMWPSALVAALVIPLLGRHPGPYRIGSLTDDANPTGCRSSWDGSA